MAGRSGEGSGSVATASDPVRVMSEECNRPESEAARAAFTAWERAPSRKDRSREGQTFRDWAAATPQEGLLSVIRDVGCGPALSYARDVIEEVRREPTDLVVTRSPS